MYHKVKFLSMCALQARTVKITETKSFEFISNLDQGFLKMLNNIAVRLSIFLQLQI